MSSSKSVRKPTPESIRWPIPLVRHNGGRPFRCVIVCHDWYGFETHYFDERTVACPGDDVCPACKADVVKRWCGTLVIGKAHAKGFSLFPITQAVLSDLQMVIDSYETLVGLVAEFGRRKGTARSQMTCAIIERRAWRGRVYTVDDLKHHTDRIFALRNQAASPMKYPKNVRNIER